MRSIPHRYGVMVVPMLLGLILFLFSSTKLLAASPMSRALSIQLPLANVDVNVPNATQWPLVHIVNTRFMQEQGHLPTLGMARLHLFRTFCLPTMTAQSTQDFLWIIKIDPKLDVAVLDGLLHLVQPHSNIYVVASNRNFLISPDLQGSWRDGAEGHDLLASQIYSGNRTKLLQAIALRQDRPVLETRLDADDGLHYKFLEYMQWVAKRRFLGNEAPQDDDKDDDERRKDKGADIFMSTPKWLYWCTRRHVEWRPGPLGGSEKGMGSSPGILNPVEHSKLCITPGITVGYNVGASASQVPSESHDLLYKHLVNSTACYDSSIKVPAQSSDKPLCLELVDDLIFGAIRSRTWTSAGMQDVAAPDFHIPDTVQSELTEKLWLFLQERFQMKREDAQQARQYLYENQAQIAYENLMGQCTSHHSCKQQAKESLEKYVKDAGATGIHVIEPPDEGKGNLRLPWRGPVRRASQ